MTAGSQSELTSEPAHRGSLALLTIPFVFTQDELLLTSEFLDRVKERGHKLSLEDLQRFHSHNLLLPLFRVSDTPVEGRRIKVDANGGSNARGWTLEAAASGRLRDPAEEGYSIAWPYTRPDDQDPREWWNGFVYSSWQLLNVRLALNEYQFIEAGFRGSRFAYQRRARERRLTIVLAALATRYLPGVLHHLTMPGGVDEEALRRYRAKADLQELLWIANFDPADLQAEADTLLHRTFGEPLSKWLPLVRYASYRGWSQLRGEPLDAMWRRVAAEVLLRAHEELAADGLVQPLPDLTGAGWHSAQHDRLTPRYAEAETLEHALNQLGLSPYPKVILLVEGETELHHVPKLLAELGLTQPQDVRVQRTKGSKINAHLIARYGVTPRVGRKVGDLWLLDASLTALVIAMDAENSFETQAMRDDVRRNLQEAIREEVLYQDSDISQDELDYLVHVRVWGSDKYELANFTDNELVPAITTLATRQQNPRVALPNWEQDLRAQLQAARAVHSDIKVPLGRMRVREDKVELAKLLWPVLLSKFDAELASGQVVTPVVELAVEVLQLVAKVAGVSALAGPT